MKNVFNMNIPYSREKIRNCLGVNCNLLTVQEELRAHMHTRMHKEMKEKKGKRDKANAVKCQPGES